MGMNAVFIFQELLKNCLTPGIVFRNSRRQCDEDVRQVAKAPNLKLKPAQKVQIKTRIEQICAEYKLPLDVITSYPSYQCLTDFGVAPHHAGHLSAWRVLIEKLMSEGAVRCIFATSTVAAGVDFPARTVVITASKKKGHFGVKRLTPSEFHQMAGRAGRRGKDLVGYCLFSTETSAETNALIRLSLTKPENLKSYYYVTPSTILSVLKYRDLDFLLDLTKKSFGNFSLSYEAKLIEEQVESLQQNMSGPKFKSGRVRAKVERLMNSAREFSQFYEKRLFQLLEVLEKAGYIQEGFLTQKGTIGAELNSSFVLEIVEILQSDVGRLIDGPDKLIQIFGLISSDGERSFLKGRLSLSRQNINKIRQLIDWVNGLMAPFRPYSTTVDESAAFTITLWSQSSNWSEFSKLVLRQGVALGDVARAISQTADILNQLTKLDRILPDIAYFADQAKQSLLKHPFSESI